MKQQITKTVEACRAFCPSFCRYKKMAASGAGTTVDMRGFMHDQPSSYNTYAYVLVLYTFWVMPKVRMKWKLSVHTSVKGWLVLIVAHITINRVVVCQR